MSDVPSPTPPQAPPPPPPRAQTRVGPSLGSRLGSIFTSDLPLKFLALVLALLMWGLTRDQLKTSVIFKDVIVDVLELPSDVLLREATPYRVEVAVQGTRAEIEQARAALEKRSRHIGLRFPPVDPSASEGAEGPLNDPSLYNLPFASRDIVQSVTPGPVIAWVRTEERTVPIAVPSTIPAADSSLELAEGFPKLDTLQVVVRGPVQVVRGLSFLVPDAVDPNAELARKPDLFTPFPWTSAFEHWRELDPLRDRRLFAIQPASVKGTIKYRRTEGRPLTHALHLLFPAAAIDGLRDYEAVLTGGPEFDPATLTLTLKVRGDRRSLDDMAASPAKWSFAVQVPPTPGPGEPAIENHPVPVLLTFDPAIVTGRAGAAPAALDGSPTLFLTLRRRDR